MPYVVLDIIEKIEMSGHDTEAEARAHCRKHRYPLNIIFENTFDEIFEDRYGPPVAIYVWGQGYNTVPVEKDVPYSTYRVIPERLPSAPGFVAVLVGHKHYKDVQAEIEANARRISAQRVGTVQRILVEGASRKDATELMGRTECNRIVNFPGGAHPQRLVGQLIDVTITQAYPHSLRGEVLTRELPVAA